jgi:hypothetical protein
MEIILKQLQKDVLHEAAKNFLHKAAKSFCTKLHKAAKKLRLHTTANKSYGIFYNRKGGRYVSSYKNHEKNVDCWCPMGR